MNNHYKYIITGAGAAGLSLAMRLIKHDVIKPSDILLLDSEEKSGNDRTWCFWDKGKISELYAPIIYKSWDEMAFYHPDYHSREFVSPYRYNMIRSADFYAYCQKQISPLKVTIADIKSITEKENVARVESQNGRTFTAEHLFNSIPLPQMKYQSALGTLQHFGGWFIETVEEIFDAECARFMDFSVPQENGTTFFYLLPLKKNKALIEIAVFSRDVWENEIYDEAIKQYLKEHFPDLDYLINSREYGVIPMTSYPFRKHNSSHITHIGTAGGYVKASSGYAFQYIQKYLDDLIAEINKNSKSFKIPYRKWRHRLYDEILLDVILNERIRGDQVFLKIFSQNSISEVLHFLSEDARIGEELNIIGSLPKLPFIKGLFNRF